MHFATTEKIIFPSMFSREIPLNWLMSWESFSFGMKVVIALLHAVGMDWVFQATSISFHSNFRRPGQLLNTL